MKRYAIKLSLLALLLALVSCSSGSSKAEPSITDLNTTVEVRNEKIRNEDDKLLIFHKELAQNCYIDISKNNNLKYRLSLLDLSKETTNRENLNLLITYSDQNRTIQKTIADTPSLVKVGKKYVTVDMQNLLGDLYDENLSYSVQKFDKKMKLLSKRSEMIKNDDKKCELDLDHLLAKNCTLINKDNAQKDNVDEIWGSIDCGRRDLNKTIDPYIKNPDRVKWMKENGDDALTALGIPQGNSSYRKLIVKDGDDYFGERCEIGKNKATETFVGYFEGDYRVTFLSVRLDENFPLSTDLWQFVFQMKQAQVTNNSDGTPILALAAKEGQWQLTTSLSAGFSGKDRVAWHTPAQVGVWTRFAFEILYSQDPKKGWVKIYVDLNGDGDTLDVGEQSPKMYMSTLKYQLAGPDKSIAVGDSVPSHFRVGPYHDANISCPTDNCSFGLDNVQVIAPW